MMQSFTLPFRHAFRLSRLFSVSIALLSACACISAFAADYTETLILKFIQEDYSYLHQNPLSVDGTNIAKGSYSKLETHSNTLYSPVKEYACTGVFTVACDHNDINGRVFWYPYATLGTPEAGATLTISFSQFAIEEYGDYDKGVYVNKVVIKGCGNKYSTEAAKICVNGIEREVPYTETPGEKPGNIPLYDLTFDFGPGKTMETLSIEAPATGISFNSIEVYAVKTRKLSFEKPIVDCAYPNGESVRLQYADANIDGVTKSFGLMTGGEIGSIYLYEVFKADGTSAGDVSYTPVKHNSETYTDTYFKPTEEGLYTVRAYMSEESGYYGEASYLLNVYWDNPETLTFNSGITHDGIITIYDRYIDKDGNLRTDKDVYIDGIPEGANLYYRVWDDPDFTPSQNLGDDEPETPYRPAGDGRAVCGPAMKAVAADEDTTAAAIDDMTLYDEAKGIDMSNGDTIDLALEKNGSLSPTESIRYQKINVPVGVEKVWTPAEPATYFHIDGRRADENAKGLLIRITASGQTDKIIRR